MKYWIERIVIGLGVVGLVGGTAAWYLQRDKGQTASFHTAPVKRGDLVVSIGATGTVEPEEVIDVGAQVAGQIMSFGKDVHGKTIDYGSAVEEGTVLARIDDSLYTAQAIEADAQVQSAKAGLQRCPGRPGAAQGQAGPGGAGLAAGPEAWAVRGLGPGQL